MIVDDENFLQSTTSILTRLRPPRAPKRSRGHGTPAARLSKVHKRYLRMTYLLLLLGVRVRNEGTVEPDAALPGHDGAVVVGLGDEQRSAICLAATFDRACAEAVEIDAAARVDPAEGTHVAYEHLKLRQLVRHTRH